MFKTEKIILEDTLERESLTPGMSFYGLSVTLIKAGMSSNGNLYTAKLLKESYKKFEGAKCYDGHDPGSRKPSELIGVYENVFFNEATEEIKSMLRILPDKVEWIKSLRRVSDVGLSVHYSGEWTENKDGTDTIISITGGPDNGNPCCDLVMYPAARGKLESLNINNIKRGEINMGETKPVESSLEINEDLKNLKVLIEEQNKENEKYREVIKELSETIRKQKTESIVKDFISNLQIKEEGKEEIKKILLSIKEENVLDIVIKSIKLYSENIEIKPISNPPIVTGIAPSKEEKKANTVDKINSLFSKLGGK